MPSTSPDGFNGHTCQRNSPVRPHLASQTNGTIGCRASRTIREEVAQNQHLTDADRQNAERFDDGPPQDAFVQIFGAFSALRLAQSQVRLEVGHLLQRLVDFARRRFHLRERRFVLFDGIDEGLLVADLQVHVDELVRERRELVAEAETVNSLQLRMAWNVC